VQKPAACISTVRIETEGSSETMVPVYQTTRSHTPEESILIVFVTYLVSIVSGPEQKLSRNYTQLRRRH
jgi:hypothetical protein